MMRANILAAAALGMIFATGSVAAMPALTAAQLFDVCGSSTISEAAAKGDSLGWPRMTDAQLEEWRSSFVAYNGGSVQVLAWRRGEKDGDDSLSFWIARGPNGHRACSYSTASPAGLLDALSEHFGAPDTLDKYEFGATATWKRDTAEIYFSQVGSRAGVTISGGD
jgi:hypothetical protein